MKARFGIVLFIGSALFFPRLAAADPITLSSGFYIINEDGPYYRFVSSGFVIDGTGVLPGRSALSLPSSLWCAGCYAGEEHAFSAETAGEVFLGLGTIATGSSTIESARLFGHLKFVAPTVVLPPAGASVLYYRLPFVLTGFVRALDTDHPGIEIYTPFQAAGFASARFSPRADGRWDNGEGDIVRYEISSATPTPEPASLLLLGAGIAGVAFRKRRSAIFLSRTRDVGGRGPSPSRFPVVSK